MQTSFRFAAAAGLAMLMGPAFGQGTYPSRPVTTIIPAAPGASADIESRIYNQELSNALGQQFVIDFKPGGALSVGLAYVAKQKPDGYTLLWTGNTITLQPIIARDKPYDVYRDFDPVSLMTKRSAILAASMNMPFTNIREFVAYAKANPGKVNFATGGIGGSQHLTGLWLTSETGTQVTFVNYKAISAAYPDMFAGRTHMIPGAFSGLLPFVKSGKMRAIGIASLQRNPALPDVPTVAEQGIPGFEYSSWLGMFAPHGTPAAIVNLLQAQLVKVAASPAVKEKVGDDAILMATSPAEFHKAMLAETARYKRLIEDNNIRFDD